MVKILFALKVTFKQIVRLILGKMFSTIQWSIYQHEGLNDFPILALVQLVAQECFMTRSC